MIRRKVKTAIVDGARRFLGALLVVAQIAATAGGLVLLTPPEPALALNCATPGKDGAGGTLTGTVNAYYPGTASVSSGATSITVGAALSAGAKAIAVGDLLLIIQISGATIDSANTSAYGAGTTTGSGWTALNNVGKYEYAEAASALTTSGGSLTVANGLTNSYTYSSSSSSPAQFEVVRVPQYTTAALSSTLTGAPWQFASGSTLTGAGGIIALDVSGTLTLGSATVKMTGQGFTGGYDPLLTGAGYGQIGYTYVMSTATGSVSDGMGVKGEGIAGAPQYTIPYSTSGTAGTAENFGSDFLPVGGSAAGAPGNAGGGGVINASLTSYSGGGGGANGGAGGTPAYTSGGDKALGGKAVSPSATFVVMGGGGGGAIPSSSTAGYADGGSGGGMVLIRASGVSGTGTITANGTAGAVGGTYGGGGGAGGTVMVSTTSGTLSGLTVDAVGGGGGTGSSMPGGAGGGGAVLLSTTGATTSAAAGSAPSGTGAAGAGVVSTSISSTSIPGVSSGAQCAALPSMTITNPSAQNVSPGATVTDTFTLKNTSSGSGNFALTGAATFGGTASGTTLTGFILAGASSGTCSTASPCSYTTLNSQSGMSGIAANGTKTVGAVYVVSSSAAGGQTIQPSITANVTVSSTTSSNVTNTTYSDTVNATMTITSPTAESVTPADVEIDTFTLKNTSASSGTLALTADAAFGGTASGTTLKGYVLNGASSGTCSTASLCTTYTTLNAAITSTASGGTITVGVEFQASSSATSGQTVQPSVTATNTAGGTTSASVTSAAYSDTLITDARLDVQASASISGSNINWTITANDGGGYLATGLASAKTLLGASKNGIVIFVPTPSYNGTYLTLQSQPSTPTLNGASSGAAAALYYNATACASSPTSGWSATYSSSAKCIAVYVSDSSASVLPSATSGSSGAGSVTTAQITYAFTTNQPSGSGSGNANAVTLIASSAIGGNPWESGAVPIVGEGIAAGASQDAATASLLNAIQSNATASSGTTSPGGASNQADGNATVSYSLTHGPYASAGATGLYPGGSGSADDNHDYTAQDPPCTNNGSASVNGLSCSVSSTGVGIINEVDNTGNATDTGVLITVTAPAGWTVQLYSVSSCSGGGSTWPTCTQGSTITSQSTAGGSVSVLQSIASGGAVDYEALYRASGNSATPFTAYAAQLTAAGQMGAGTGADANNTYNVLYPGGVVQLTNTLTVTSTGCPSGESPSNSLVCPGGTLSYSVGYANAAPSNAASNLGTEPAFAYNALYTEAGSLVITDDGAASPGGAPAGNNWPTYSGGIAAAVTDTTSGTVITYYPSVSTTYSANQTKFTAQIGGSSYQLPPGGSGTTIFTIVVK